MKVSQKDIDKLREIQDIDVKINSELAKFSEMPEHLELKNVIVVQSDMIQKRKKVDCVEKDAGIKQEKMTNEDINLQQREISVQKSIEEAAGDYRNLEARTKELDGIASRRSVLADMMIKLSEEQDKVSDLKKKLDAGIRAIENKREDLTSKIESAKESAEKSVSSLRESRSKLYGGLNQDLADIYSRASSNVGNVVLSSLQDDRCSVCRSTIDAGRLIEMKNEGGIALCPHCGRIIVL